MRADPNAEIPSGSISPLMNVSMFAPLSRVVAMRKLLLAHGAILTKDDKEYWDFREENDPFEQQRVKAFYEDDRHHSPVGAAMGI